MTVARTVLTVNTVTYSHSNGGRRAAPRKSHGILARGNVPGYYNLRQNARFESGYPYARTSACVP